MFRVLFRLITFLLMVLLFLPSCSDREYKNIFDPENTAPGEWSPKNLQISQISISEVQLGWRKVHPDITGFVIDRRIGDGEWEQNVAILTAAELSWSDTAFALNTPCYYRVLSVAGEQLSQPALISINPIIPEPQILSSEQVNDTEVKLIWSDRSDGEQGFIIDRKVNENDWEVGIDTLPANSTEWVDSNVNIDQSLQYHLYAYYQEYTSRKAAYSMTISFPAPQNFRITVVSPTQVKISWQAHPFNNISEYRIERSTDLTDFTQVGSVSGAATEYADATVDNTHVYRYRVYAATAQNQSTYTNVKKIEWKGPFTYQWSGFHDTQINSVDIHPEGVQTASVSSDKILKVWDNRTGELLWSGSHSSWVKKVEYNLAGTKILSYSDYEFKVWDATSGAELFMGSHTGNLNDVHFSQDGQYIISGGGTTVSLWDAENGTNLWTVENYPDASYDDQKEVSAVAISPDNSLIAACGDYYSKLNLWQTSNKSLLWYMTRQEAFCLKFSPDNKWLFVGSKNWMTVMDVNNYGQTIWSVQGTANFMNVKINPNGTQVLTVKTDQIGTPKSTQVWNYQTHGLVWENSDLMAPTYNSAGSLIAGATCSWGGITIYVLNSSNGSLFWAGSHEVFQGSPNFYIYGIAFSADDRYLATGGGTGEIKLWKSGYDWEVSDED
jgi:WD40 repeat protein